jgi:hypothetical protein
MEIVARCTVHAPLVPLLGQGKPSLLSLPSVTISLAVGESILVSPFGFLPVLASGIEGKLSGESEQPPAALSEIPEGAEMQEVQLGLDKVGLLTNKEFAGLLPLQKLESVVMLLHEHASPHYMRYFVNNCLTVDGGKNVTKEETVQIRQTLSQLISQNYLTVEVKKDSATAYVDNFALRPFTGVRLKELPTPKPEEQGGGYSWDNLYTDTELSAQQLGLSK